MTDTEKLKKFAELVEQMRDSQQSYFRWKAADRLRISKRLEGLVDVEVKKILQPGLFADAAAERSNGSSS